MNNKNAVVVIPTYNAKKSIIKLISKILQYNKNVQSVIVVDDNSPDKTAQLIKKHFPLSKSVKLIVRDKKSGRGSAVIRGFKEGLKNKKIKYFVEMDADLSHDPKYIPQLIKVCLSKDVAVASKYLKESKIIDLPLYRKLISQVANIFLKQILGLPISDYTNGFRCYTRKVIKTIDLDSIQAKGFSALTEIAYIIHKNKFSFGEIPVSVKYCQATGSNFNIHEVEEGLLTVFRLLRNKFFVFSLPRVLWRFIHNNKEILFLLFLTLIFFHKIILRPQEMIYPAYDVIGIYSFWKTFFVESINQYGSLPLWNPYVFSGSPFLGSSQSSMFYPTSILFLLFPIDIVFGYIFLIDIALIGIFTYLFARKIHLLSFGAVIASIIMMFNGAIIGKLIPGHIFILDGIVWFPILLYFYEGIIQSKKYTQSILAGLPIALMLLSGNAQIALYSLLTTILYFFFRINLRKKNTFSIKNGFLFCFPLLIGFSLAAIQLLPSFEFSKLSVRAEGLSYIFASDFSMHPYQLITFVLPHFFGSPFIENSFWGINGNFWEICAYAGILPLVLSICALILKRNKLTIFFTLLAVFSIFFAMGKFGFIFPLFYNYIPGFNLFRAPARFLFVYGFSISILAGIGSDILIDRGWNKLKNMLFNFLSYATIIVSLTSIVLYFLTIENSVIISIIQSKGYALGNNLTGIHSLITKDLFLLSIISFFIFITLQLKTRLHLPKQYLKALFLLIIISDLWLFGLKFYDTKNPKEIYKPLLEINMLKTNKEYYRTFDYEGNYIGYLAKNKIQILNGYDAVYLKDYRDFLWLAGNHSNTPYESFFTFSSIDNIFILKLLNTKYLITKNNLSFSELKEVYTNRYRIYEITNTFPKAYIVPNAIVVKDRAKLLDLLQSNTYNPMTYVLLERMPTGTLNNLSSFKKVSIIKYNPNEIQLTTTLLKPGFLVLADTWYPGWKAYDNGKEIEIYKANHIQRALFLNEGNHNIVFSYEPDSYKKGAIISLLTLFTICIFLIKTFYFTKKTKISS